MVNDKVRQDEIDWIQLKKDMDAIIVVETMTEKFARKFNENPVIPIGCAATVAALTYGVYNFAKGRSMMSQYMMRTRVVAQGITIFAVVYSLSAVTPKQQ